MSKAEERAMEHCCAKCVNNKLNCGMKLLQNGQDCIKCGNYIKGYEQAEKDLELSWKDIEKIDDITLRLDASAESRGMSNQEFYQEVLKRFKTTKD